MSKRRLLYMLISLCAMSNPSLVAQNTIDRDGFNFGHQSGYMYSRSDSAWGNNNGGWSFETGFLAYHTPEMPMARNPKYRSRTMLLVPLHFEWYPCQSITLQFDLTDLFLDFPYERLQENAGGKSPRVRTKIGLLGEGTIMPAVALTMGVTWSSAKPYTIWAGRHNYDSSNGLAGAGTGVADYLILFTASKRLNSRFAVHVHLGLAPLGSPVPYTLEAPLSSANCQADEIPYGLALDTRINSRWWMKNEIAGMYNGLRTTSLAHYSVIRSSQIIQTGPVRIAANLERGLTISSDTWVAGMYISIPFVPRKPGGR